MNRRTYRGAALVLVVLSASAACSDGTPPGAWADREGTGPLPMSLHGMPLVAVTASPEAEGRIRDLHGESVAPTSSYIGRYAGGGVTATLYVSRFAGPEEARTVLRKMAHSIGSGNPTLAHHTSFEVDAVRVHALLGQGRTHFFYARGADVAWVSVDRAMARVVLADLLGAGTERLPAGIQLDGVDILPPPDSLYRRGPPAPPTSMRRVNPW